VFVHLHTHSYYSLLEALPSPAELVQKAGDSNMPALALTDHRMLSGTVEFTRACRKNNVQPILGLELDAAIGGHSGRIVLLATNLNGWSNLCRLSSALLMQSDDSATASLDLLAGHASDLLLLTDGLGDTFGDMLSNLAEIFPNRLYVELQAIQDSRLKSLADLADKFKLPVVATNPIYTLTVEQAPLLKTLNAIRLVQPVNKLTARDLPPTGTHFLTVEEMVDRFKAFPSALAATLEIAERCKFDLPLGVPHLPSVPLPAGKTASQVLRQKAEAGARRLYGQVSTTVQQRLDHELDAIAKRGFEPVFLIVEELLNFAREQGIPFSSRGSAASSLVAHCLGITSPDPLRHNLYFERFLNPARTTPPDIDTDLCSRRRDEIIQHVFDVYGADRVAMVGTINRFRPRSALGDVGKAHGLPEAAVRELTATLPYGFFARMESDESEEEERPSPFAELEEKYPQHKPLYEEAEALQHIPRHLSVHAGGLVVAPGTMTDLVPVMHSGSKGVTITQLDLESVEALGLVKIDLLGIRGLTVMGDVAAAVHSWRSKEYKRPMDVLESIPETDAETSTRLEKGLTIGCFQIESPGMRATLREIHARTIDDLIAALSLYRPGPITGGMKDAFVRRFKGEEKVEYLHPAVEPILKETFGVVMYQEQVLRLAHDLAGLSLADSDLLRRAMSHFDPGKQMQTLKERFLAGAQQLNNVPTEAGERIWQLMAAFAGYGFPKAHAASYAQVAWRSAWCKTHFPAEFMAAVMANWGGYYSQRVYLTEARRLGLTVRPPHVNHARREFSVAYPQGKPVLYMGLDQVRDLTSRTQERIIHLRPFHTLEELLSKVDPRKQEAENLILCGALEGIGTIPMLLSQLKSGSWQPSQMSLFGAAQEAPTVEGWTVEQKMDAQQEVLGVSVEAHPLELHKGAIARAGAISTIEAVRRIGQRVTVAGMRMTSRRYRNSKGMWMMFLTLEDLEGMLDAVLLPDVNRRYRFEVTGSVPLLVTGTVEQDASRGEPSLRVEKISRLL
jgi:DNA-directed DNA polymerase III PolC